MTKMAIFEFGSPERRLGRTTKSFRLMWLIFCWTLAFCSVTVALAAAFRWARMI
ncbi:MAG TPA: hypothetical protein VE309_02995 [Caulobacteraceae bacterium]|jgi:hypothetical protein|nr:hypothetical protein [Caulobacteraceae bacterium]